MSQRTRVLAAMDVLPPTSEAGLDDDRRSERWEGAVRADMASEGMDDAHTVEETGGE